MSIDRSRWRLWALSGIAIIGIVAAGLAVSAVRNRRATPTPLAAAIRLALVTPRDLAIGGGPDYPFGLALAPDGRRLALPATQAGIQQLWLHDLTTGDTQSLRGTEDGVLPFWAPDGQTLGFFSQNKMRALTLANGRITELADAASPRGAAWHPDGDIIFSATAEGGLSQRRAADGVIEPLTIVDTGAGELGHRFPVVVNSGRHLLMYVRANVATRQGIWIAPIDQPSARTRLVGGDSHALAVDDMIIFGSDKALVGQRIDFAQHALTGRPVLLGTSVGRGSHNQLFAAASGDVLLFGPPVPGLRELRWVDRSGAPSGMVGEAMEAWDARLSPRGSTVAVTRADPQLGTLDIWVYDGEKPLPRRISLAIDVDESPVWAEDAAQLAWVTGRRAVMTRGAGAQLPEEVVRRFAHPVRVSDWSADHRWMVITESRPDTRDDIWLLDANGRAEPRAYAQTPFNEAQGTVSPSGKWIAYASDESGRFEIYVDAFPTPGRRALLTTGGGSDPRWRADGGELFFRRGTELHAVKTSAAGDRLEAVSSERLLDVGAELRGYDVAPDGQRFLINVAATNAAPRAPTVVVNVRSLLPSAP
ncbi:MAG TPA: hypothetical protein VNJ02_01465 [Vicinamibacterales bacterium]|nr:hypothetical protein [Vicinamibacterales bacterium]